MKLTKLFRSTSEVMTGLVLSRSRTANIAAFHLGRSGSRLLGDLIKQNPAFVWDGELFSPGRLEGISSRWPLLPRNPLRVLRLRMALAGRRCYGFETQPPQVEYLDLSLEDYVQRLEQLGFNHFVLLRRKNQLRRIVSMLVARQTSEWHVTSQKPPSKSEIELDVDRLLLSRGRDTEYRPLAEHLQRDEDQLKALGEVLSSRRLLCLSYEEDLASRPETAYERVCDFVGIEPHPVQIRFRRTNPYPLSKIIKNFAEVERALKGTSFEWMLYAD